MVRHGCVARARAEEPQSRASQLGRSATGIVADAFKTQRRANGTVLRSKTPDRVQQVVQQVVQQERWGLLLAPFAVRQRMTQAAWARRLDPDRLGFTHAVRVIKRKMPQAAAIAA